MFRTLGIIAAVVGVTLTIAAGAFASSADNSVQPGRTFYGTVRSGDHPNRLVILHNGTGHARRIATIAIAGAGGYVFTLASGTSLLAASGLPECRTGQVIAAGARCALDVRLHTTRVGWFRAVIRIVYRNRWMNSGQLQAHVVAP